MQLRQPKPKRCSYGRAEAIGDCCYWLKWPAPPHHLKTAKWKLRLIVVPGQRTTLPLRMSARFRSCLYKVFVALPHQLRFSQPLPRLIWTQGNFQGLSSLARQPPLNPAAFALFSPPTFPPHGKGYLSEHTGILENTLLPPNSELHC